MLFRRSKSTDTNGSLETAEVLDDALLEEQTRQESDDRVSSTVTEADPAADPAEFDETESPERARNRFARTRGLFRAPFSALRGRGKVDARAIEELEEALILADVGLPTTTALLDQLQEQLRTGEIGSDGDALVDGLEALIIELFRGEDRSLHEATNATTVWLFVGVNGVGKTTTIGKMAHREKNAGKSVVLAAGDTFRAAAGEQLALWAARTGVEIVQGADGADPSSVIFDAIQHAAATHLDLVLADSAGRLHNKTNLMEELKKVRRVADRDPGSVAEVLLVLDATTGQNGLAQARQFKEAVGVTGVVLTKLDGTAKGGIVLAIRHELDLPIKLVGLGEGVDDLVEFDPEEFAAALFA